MPQLAFGLDFSAVPHHCPSLEEAPAPVLVSHLHPIHQQVLEVGFLELPGLVAGWLVSACPPLLPLVLLGTKKGSPAHLHSREDALLGVLEHFYLVDAPCFSDERHGLGS